MTTNKWENNMYNRIRIQTLKMALCCLVAAIGSSPALTAAEELLYVSPTGNAAGTGKLDEQNAGRSDGPLATMDGARKAVRIRIAAGLKQPVTVNTRGGEYAQDRTVVFGPKDSGTKKYPVTYTFTT